ncbi:hypothetical protein SAMN04488554_1570 [Ruania alba]|uniref:CAAX prenyl protease 2/Lysostaphin resistance protein A-like domain-containing protein n=1 Tax=Ruania alba TaxID=648782 RepID=A0A1H5G829_9MICO|nr:hypothetical protein SAMN04488554_1570 [Ruania alba]
MQGVVVILAITVVVFGAALALLLTAGDPAARLPIVVVPALLVHTVLAGTALIVIVRRSPTTFRSIGFTKPTARLWHLLWQVPVIITVAVLVQVATSVLTSGASEDAGGSIDSLLTGTSGTTVVVLVVTLAVLVPFWEETLFRGLIFTSTRARWGTGVATAVTALLFAIAHGIPILLPYYVTLGFALSLLRIFHRSIWGPLVLHVTINTIASTAVLTTLG